MGLGPGGDFRVLDGVLRCRQGLGVETGSEARSEEKWDFSWWQLGF